MAQVVVRPHARPRDLRDAFIAIVAVLLIGAAAFLVAFILLELVVPSGVAVLGAGLAVAGVFGAIALRTVWALEIDDAGIRFRRVLGRPRFLAWDVITSVRRADRAEVVLRGWLMPPVAMRACAATLTSQGHYRFDWAGGWTYFPPADEDVLLAQLERSWGGIL